MTFSMPVSTTMPAPVSMSGALLPLNPMTLRAAAVVPPMMFCDDWTVMPETSLPPAVVPFGSTPM